MQKKGQKRALSENETFKTPGVVSNDNPIKNKKAFKANVENNKIVPIKTEQTVNAKKNDAKTAENTPAAGKGGSNKRKEFSVEEIKDRVTSILSRNALSKRAKRRLALFKKLLQLKGCDIKDIKVDEKPKQNEKKENSSIKKNAGEKGPIAQKVDQAKVNKPEKPNQNKIVVKQEKKSESKEKSKVQKQKNLVQIKKEPGLEEDSDEDDSDDEEEVEAAKPPKKLMSLTQGDSDDDDDDEDDEDDEDDDDDDDDDDEDEEEEVQNGKADVSMEQDSDDDEDDDEEEEKAQKPKGVEAKKQGKKPGQGQDSGDSKKKRYVLFVGNIPYDASVEDLKKHFLTKVSDVASVRIPTAQGTNSPRGFAYVEVSNNIDFEKGLSLHNSFLKGRKIKVEYTSPGSKNISNKKDVVVKNKKLQALRKAGKLAGSQNDNQKRNARRMKQKQGNKKPE